MKEYNDPIYVKFKIPKTVKEFLKEFFSGPKGFFNGYSVETYKDEACTQVQCKAGRARSVQEIFACVRTYYPNVQLSELVREIASLELPNKKFNPYRCCTILKPVVSFSTDQMWGDFPRKSPWPWSWGALLRGAGFNSKKELYGEK